jgi:hypothetical protein
MAFPPIQTVQVLLDDLVQKPTRSGSPGEIMTLFFELYHSDDPFLQMFILFVFVFIGIPFIGGCLVLLWNFTAEDKNRFVWFQVCVLYIYFRFLLYCFYSGQFEHFPGFPFVGFTWKSLMYIYLYSLI